MKSGILRLILPLGTAALLYLSFPPVGFFPLAWFAWVPALVFIATAKKLRWMALGLYGAGYLYEAFSYLWLRHVWGPATWIMALYLALFWVASGLAIRGLRYARLPLGVAAPLALVPIEYARATWLSGAPWFLLGHTQGPWVGIIQVADLGGVYLVSLLVAAASGALAQAVAAKLAGGRPITWLAPPAAAAFLVGAAWGYGALRLRSLPIEDGPTVGVVQPNIPQEVKVMPTWEERADVHRKLLALTEGLFQVHGRPDLLVWPEAVFLYPLIWSSEGEIAQDPGTGEAIMYAKGFGTDFLVSVVIYEPGDGGFTDEETGRTYRAYNSALWLDAEGRVRMRYDKVRLVPFSEELPLRRELPFLEKLVVRWSELKHVYEFTRGRRWDPGEAGGMPYGVLVCFEGVFPDLSRRWVRRGARFLVNVSNDGWFKDSAELAQALEIVRFRAVEFRRGVVRATNTGISAFIAPTGRIELTAADPGTGRREEVTAALTHRVRTSPVETVYARWGDLPTWIVCVAGLAGISAGAVRRVRNFRPRGSGKGP